MKRLSAFILAVVMLISASITVSAAGKSPVAPDTRAYSKSYQSITLEWTRPKNTSGYVIYRSVKKDKGFKAIKTIKSAKTLSYVDSGLDTGKTYYYKVQAYNSAGKSKTNVVSAVPSLSKPVIKVTQVEAETNRIIISRPVEGAQYYEVYIANTRNNVFRCIKNNCTSLRLKVINQTSKVLYAYKVRAYRIVKGKKVYSPFSKIKTCKVL